MKIRHFHNVDGVLFINVRTYAVVKLQFIVDISLSVRDYTSLFERIFFEIIILQWLHAF